MSDAYRCPQCGLIDVEHADHFDEVVLEIFAEDPVDGILEGGYPNCPQCPPPQTMEPINVAWTPRDVVAQHTRRQRLERQLRDRPEPLRARHDWRSPV